MDEHEQEESKIETSGEVTQRAPEVARWDFETVLGETIREMYASEYVKVVEINNLVNRKPMPPSESQ